MGKLALVKLQDLLLQERDAALSGNLDALNNIGTAKESLLELLLTEKPSTEGLRGLSEDIVRNQTIIESVIAGVQSAQRHLLVTELTSGQVSVYNKDGTLEEIDICTTLTACRY